MKRSSIFVLFGSVIGFIMVLAALSLPSIVVAQDNTLPDQSSATAPLTVAAASPVTSTFTYQGQLKNGGSAVNGSCDMAFRLYDDPNAGNLIGNPITLTVPINNGYFTVGLNFGNAVFDGNGRWLELQVRCPNGSGSFTALSRQALTPAPYSSYSLSAGALQGYPVASSAPGNGQVLKWNGSNWVPGTDNTSGVGGSWDIVGNAGTNAGTNFLGTTDTASLTLRVNNMVAYRFAPNGTNTPNVIGGSGSNVISPTVTGGTIDGGGDSTYPNIVQGDFSTIGGGRANLATADRATIGGGTLNSALSSYTTIGGGRGNVVSGTYTTIGGGWGNTANGDRSTVAGGYSNQAAAAYAFIGGGGGNIANGSAATVAGGGSNTSSGANSFVGAGIQNIAGGNYSVVGGGLQNHATISYTAIGGGYLNTANGIASTVAGGQGNLVQTTGAMIGGGYSNTVAGPSNYASIGGGFQNLNSGLDATIGGGYQNIAGNSYATVGGGANNFAGNYATVGGGGNNFAGGITSTIGGGQSNIVQATGAMIGGGYRNTVTSLGNYAFVGGGSQNTVSAQFATVGGGVNNTASVDGATVGGGAFNTAKGGNATVPGGVLNTAQGIDSFAAGCGANANHDGAFVWADFQCGPFSSTGVNQFLIRAAGHVGINTNSTPDAVDVQTVSGNYGNYGFVHTDGTVSVGTWVGLGAGWFGTKSPHPLYFFTSGGSARMAIDTAGNVGIGTISPTQKLDVNGAAAVNVLQIRGGSDIAEPFLLGDQTNVEPGTVMVIDPDHPGQLKVSATAYDRKVAGIVSGAGGINPGLTLEQAGITSGKINVALAGRVYCKSEATSAPIEPGDFLTTSNRPGYCMKAIDRDLAFGAIIGKAMSSLKTGTGLVLVLVNLQ